MMKPLALLLLALLASADARAARRRALLIGINDYTGAYDAKRKADRDWRDLAGPVNDVGSMREMLIGRYRFDPGDIVTLTDRKATRRAILDTIERHLVLPAADGDIVVFYFAGHGSQVRNSRSDERDRMDESFVPADSLAGAHDIRDKEVRPLFNAILDRGARLTIILDKCHSGSGARGTLRARAIEPDQRDVADRTPWGPRPEDRGALVLAATQDFDPAWETVDGSGTIRGTFSWALIRAMRDSRPGESASETFLRARARLRGETPFQQPVMAGTTEARRAPLFGGSVVRSDGRAIVAVEKTRDDGTVVIHGGPANGISVGTELQHVSDPATRLIVTRILALGRSEARVQSGRVVAGATFESVTPAPSRIRTLVESAPRTPSPFRLAIRHVGTGEIAKRILYGNERYRLTIEPVVRNSESRFVYVFVVDSAGRSSLLYPTRGSVENRFSTTGTEQSLSTFRVTSPYGSDTFFLLTTDEALADPWVFEWDGILSRDPTVVETWSIDRMVFQSVPPRL